MNVATIPPGGVAYAHIHVGFELMLYILQGRVRHEYGPGLKKSIENEAGDFIYIEPGRSSRGVQPERQRAGGRRRRPLRRQRVGEYRPLRQNGFGTVSRPSLCYLIPTESSRRGKAQRRTAPSMPPVAITAPSGENANALTPPCAPPQHDQRCFCARRRPSTSRRPTNRRPPVACRRARMPRH